MECHHLFLRSQRWMRWFWFVVNFVKSILNNNNSIENTVLHAPLFQGRNEASRKKIPWGNNFLKAIFLTLVPNQRTQYNLMLKRHNTSVPCWKEKWEIDRILEGKIDITAKRKIEDLTFLEEMSEAIRKFLLPVDGSVHSERAFDYYLKNVHRPGDKLDILHVHEPPLFPENAVVFGPSVNYYGQDWEKDIQKNLEKSKETLEKFKKKCEENGVECSVQVKPVAESAGETICATAREREANGIIVGSRGLNLIRRTLLGSVSSYVVNHADVPVTVARPHTDGK